MAELKYNPDTGEFTRDGGKAGTLKNNGYLAIWYKQKMWTAHKLAWYLFYGEKASGQVDHIDHDRLNNRIQNLREVSHKENNKNKSKGKNNTSGCVGVNWNKRLKKWTASIMAEKSIFLGCFSKYSDAVDARKNAEILYGFHKNHGKSS